MPAGPAPAAMSGPPGDGGPLAALARLLCLLGFHDYRVLSRTFGFGAGSNVEKVECRRCGHVTARQGEA